MYRIAFVLCCIWCFASVAKAENLSQENTTDLLKIHPNDTEQIIESHKLGFEIDEMQVSILPTMVWGGTLPQLISFHLGYNATQLDSKIQSGGSVGASAGVNYFLPNPLYWNLLILAYACGICMNMVRILHIY